MGSVSFCGISRLVLDEVSDLPRDHTHEGKPLAGAQVVDFGCAIRPKNCLFPSGDLSVPESHRETPGNQPFAIPHVEVLTQPCFKADVLVEVEALTSTASVVIDRKLFLLCCAPIFSAKLSSTGPSCLASLRAIPCHVRAAAGIARSVPALRVHAPVLTVIHAISSGRSRVSI